MANLETYLNNYGDMPFYRKPFNDIDAAILSNISYMDLEGIVPEDKKTISLYDAISKFIYFCDYKEFLNRGFIQKDIYRLAKLLLSKKRYTNIKMQHYARKVDEVEQFCAMSFRLPNNQLIVCFEGTDHHLCGWEEDVRMAYEYPVPSQIDAISYLQKVVGFFDRNVIVLGHSKGGNLALVASMHVPTFIRKKIKVIYSFDGPGLRKKEFESNAFKKIENKLRHIVPNYSVFGLLLRHNDSFEVIRSSRKDLFAHSIFTWQVEDNHFVPSKLSRLSKNLDESIIIWLEQHDDKTREKLSNALFQLLRKSGITNFMETRKLKNIITILKNSKKIDGETKKLLIHFLKFNISYCFTNRKDK